MSTVVAPSPRYRLPGRPTPEITTYRIPSGPRGTERTVAHIKSLILEGAKDFSVRQKAIDILMARAVNPKDYLGEIKALFEWVQRNIRYTRDPFRVELLHSPMRMLELRAGDCDDMTILLGAMLESIGHPVRVVVVGPNPLRPGLFTHVYAEVSYLGRWIPLDPTMPYPMGWAPRAITKKVISLRRRPRMRYQAAHIGGTLAQAPPADLVRAVRSIGLQPRDPRIRQVWNQLRARGVLNQDIWVKRLLRRLWRTGLRPGNRPRTAARLAAALRTLEPWAAPSAAETPWPTALTTYPVPYGWLPIRRRRRRPYWWRVPARRRLGPFAPTPPRWRPAPPYGRRVARR
jgi:Transglutaminase-like superfamily